MLAGGGNRSSGWTIRRRHPCDGFGHANADRLVANAVRQRSSRLCPYLIESPIVNGNPWNGTSEGSGPTGGDRAARRQPEGRSLRQLSLHRQPGVRGRSTGPGTPWRQPAPTRRESRAGPPRSRCRRQAGNARPAKNRLMVKPIPPMNAMPAIWSQVHAGGSSVRRRPRQRW